MIAKRHFFASSIHVYWIGYSFWTVALRNCDIFAAWDSLWRLNFHSRKLIFCLITCRWKLGSHDIPKIFHWVENRAIRHVVHTNCHYLTNQHTVQSYLANKLQHALFWEQSISSVLSCQLFFPMLHERFTFSYSIFLNIYFGPTYIVY